jgi:hypothetical protein
LARDSLLPLGVFAATVAVHYFWTGRPPEPVAVESPWAALPTEEPSRLAAYLESGGYWLAWSYGISFAFAAVALRRFLRRRTAASGGAAVGGATFSGLLAFFGCYLTGCCGSPMLVVYLNLFGAGFLPFARPFVAGVTTLSIAGAWWWMGRADRDGKVNCAADSCDCGGGGLARSGP